MIKEGSKVSIHYTLKVDGQVIDTSDGRDPLTFTQGKKEIIPGLEAELTGLKQGEKKQVEIAPEKGYGAHDPNAVQKVPKSVFKEPEKLQVGSMVQGEVSGQSFQAAIVEVGDEQVTLDLNHPLAGKTLNFQVEIVGVE